MSGKGILFKDDWTEIPTEKQIYDGGREKKCKYDLQRIRVRSLPSSKKHVHGEICCPGDPILSRGEEMSEMQKWSLVFFSKNVYPVGLVKFNAPIGSISFKETEFFRSIWWRCYVLYVSDVHHLNWTYGKAERVDECLKSDLIWKEDVCCPSASTRYIETLQE